MLELISLSKSYGATKALVDFTYTMEYGIYGILGVNGAGKSTLLNLITDNIKREHGEIKYNGKEVHKLGKQYRKQIGYLPQQQGFYPQFTAREFLIYMGRLKGIERPRLNAEVNKYLNIVGLSQVANKKIGGFSGGMRQRVLLAQALLGEPDIIILDEPTAGLDPMERIRMRNFIATLAQTHTVLLATHVVSDIECIAKEVLLLNEGKLVRSGSPNVLIHELEGRVRECLCNQNQIEQYQRQFGLGNIRQKKEGQVLRLVGKHLPPEFVPVKEIELEDVFLYYAKQEEKK